MWGFRAAGLLIPDASDESSITNSEALVSEFDTEPENTDLVSAGATKSGESTLAVDDDSDFMAAPAGGLSDSYEDASGSITPDLSGISPDLIGVLDPELRITADLLRLISSESGDSVGPCDEDCSVPGLLTLDSSVQPSQSSIDESAIPPDLAALIDPAFRTEVDSFIKTLGAKVTHVVGRGARDPLFPKESAEARKKRLQRIFVSGRMSPDEINRICSGYSPSLKGQALNDWLERYGREVQKREGHKDWLEAQREAGRTWARWERWRRKKPQKAEEWRRQHQDEAGSDWVWMLRFAKPASTAARRAVELALRAYAVQRKTADRPPETVCAACGRARYWRKRSGDWVCAICHPPPTPADAVEWIGSARESGGRQFENRS
jgi:hypothetical protein